MNRLIIDCQALKQNINRVKTLAGSSCIYANLSGDGYGAGAVQLAAVLRQEGIRHFAVDQPETAAALRKSGLVDEEILMLRSTSDAAVLQKLVDLNVVCSVGSLEAGMALNALGKGQATVVEAHLKVDCGMGFGGFAAEEPEHIVSLIRNLPNVAMAGVYTHLSSGPALSTQLARFDAALHAIRRAGCETGVVHAAGSYALLQSEMSHLDAVRAGSILLGRCARQRGDGLVRVGRGEAVISSVRWLPRGHTLGNEHTIRLRKPTRVAVIPVGYQNGFGVDRPPVHLMEAIVRFFTSRRRTVTIHGQKARLLGAIGATEIQVNVTRLKCAEGDVASFELNPLYARGFRREYI